MDPSVFAPFNPPPVIHIPTEVCENIIDMLYSGNVVEELKNFAALRSCALVCRTWRIRAQRRLFHFVHLPDVSSLYRFAAVLRARQDLGAFVHEVSLIGHTLHTTASVLSLFPVVFAGKLPNLRELYVQHISESETWYPSTTPDSGARDRAKPKPLPYFLSALTTISTLGLDSVTFLDNDRPVPAFMEQRTGEISLSPFVPKLRGLVFLDSSIYGAERLISACGPQLRRLDISIPLVDIPDALARGSGIDLGLCSELRELYIVPSLDFSKNQQCGSELLKSMLASWDSRQPYGPTLTIGSYYQSWSFTRQGFADILHALGAVAESWLQAIQVTYVDAAGTPSGGHSPTVHYWVDIVIYDWESRSEWWWDNVYASFPTWVKLGRLQMDYYTPPAPNYEWSSDPDPNDNASEKPAS